MISKKKKNFGSKEKILGKISIPLCLGGGGSTRPLRVQVFLTCYHSGLLLTCSLSGGITLGSPNLRYVNMLVPSSDLGPYFGLFNMDCMVDSLTKQIINN